MRALIVDLLAHGKRRRLWTRDVIGSGPRTVGGILEQHGISVDLAPGEMVIEDQKILMNYDILLLSGMVIDYPVARDIIMLWRKLKGKRPIISGGPFSEYGEKLIDEGIDVVVVGEGEKTIEELISTSIFEEGKILAEELIGIKGLIFKLNGRVKYTGPRPPLTTEELRKYKPSCRLATHYPKFWSLRFYTEVVRGCSNFIISPYAREVNKIYPGCAYCNVPSYWGPSRSIPLERIVDDIKCLLDVGVNRIVLSGPDVLDYGRDWISPNGKFATDALSPPPNVDALRHLFSSIIEKTGFSYNENSIMVENVKPVTVNHDTAVLLGEYFRGTSINIGVESGDEELLNKMGRPGSLLQALTAIRLLRENGLYPQAYFIYGLPGQNESSLQKTLNVLDEVIRAGVDRIILYRLTPLPKTPLEDFIRKESLSPIERTLEEKVKLLNTSLKKRLIGEKMKVIVVGKREKYYVAYPLSHGPIVFFKSHTKFRRGIVGRIAKIKIIKIGGERAVIGKIISIGRKISETCYWEKLL